MKQAIEKKEGLAIEYNGLYWGTVYESAHSTSYGWVPLEKAEVYSHHLKKPEDATYRGSHDITELSKGTIVRIVRTVTTEILP